jgi:tetratricopeptide (TPR) repeat protein
MSIGMKQIIIVLVVLISCFRSLATDTVPDRSTPQELARQIITAFQTGRRSQIKENVAADTSILERASEVFPKDSVIYFALAICYMEQDNKPAGLKTIEKAYTLSQKDVGIGVLYALALKINKQPLKAYELNKEMVALHPDVAQLQIQLATLEMTIQEYDEAIAILEALQKKAPTNLPAQDKSVLLFMLGTCYLYTGNHAKAIDTLENALVYTPKMATALAVLGETYLKTGEMEKAVAALDKALAINSSYPEALYFKGICLEKTGNPEMAQKSFQNGYTNGKRYLRDNGEDYYLMFLISQKLSKNDESENYKTEAGRLLFSHEAPWKQK